MARCLTRRVCQYGNSSNSDLLIDWHPRFDDTPLVDIDSGHGFKHSPAVGCYAADLLLGKVACPEPCFSLAAKGETERVVH